MRLSVQLYSLREAAKKDFPRVIEAVAAMGYDGVEFAGLHGHPAADLRQVLDRVGLVASSAHCGVFDPARWGQIEEDAEILGHRRLVGGFRADDFASLEAIHSAAGKVNRALEHFTPRGYAVGIHNHWWEYDAPDKGDLLLSLCPTAEPQFDVYWMEVGGADAAEYIRRYQGRVKLIHLKDGPLERDKPMTPVGQGLVDIAGVVAAAHDARVEWSIVEIDRCDTDMLQAVHDSAKFLRPLVTRSSTPPSTSA